MPTLFVALAKDNGNPVVPGLAQNETDHTEAVAKVEATPLIFTLTVEEVKLKASAILPVVVITLVLTSSVPAAVTPALSTTVLAALSFNLKWAIGAVAVEVKSRAEPTF